MNIRQGALRACGKSLMELLLIILTSVTVFPSLSYSSDFTARTVGDYGNVTVMEVSGNYDALNPDGTANSDPRQEIAREFFSLHKDEYDFLVIFSNFDFKMPEGEANAFYLDVRNDTQGIGQEIFDNSALFGSSGKLQGMIDMGNVSNLVVDPLDPGFEGTLGVLGHEFLHRWAAYVKFKDSSGQLSTALLGKDLEHWSFLLDTDGSLLYGNKWQDNGDGTFTSLAATRRYSSLDLYLMGFNDKSKVPQMLLIDDPNTDPTRLPEQGVTVEGQPQYVTIDDIIAAEGERVPGASDSQKKLKTAFIFVTIPGTFTGDKLPGIENIRNGWLTRFSILTDGAGLMQVASTPIEDIPVNPGPLPPTVTQRDVPPDVNDGITWLMNDQMAEGSWMDMALTSGRDTSQSLVALENFDTAQQSCSLGYQWLALDTAENTDFLSREISAFRSSGQDVTAKLDELLSRQNPDGGWGGSSGYTSSVTDAALALKALSNAGYSDSDTILKAIEFLTATQNYDGGWGDNGVSAVEETSNALLAFNEINGSYQLGDSISKGAAWLAHKQNTDGGFGNSPSTVYDTSLALLALKGTDSTADLSGGVSYILGNQLGDGSWNESSYQTALGVEAMWKATIDPDLSVTNNDITVIPSVITTLPTNAVINVSVSNLGRTDVPAAKVALYDDDPLMTSAREIGGQVLAFPGNTSTTVTFSVTIPDGKEHRFYVSVDPDNLVSESNESNNTALYVLFPKPTYDLEILPSDITMTPNPVDVFQDVTITSKITNKGTMNAYNVQVAYYIDDSSGAISIATTTVDVPAGQTVTNEATWRSNMADDNLPIAVQVDPFNSIAETDEDNNKAVVPLRVSKKDITDPNLTVSYKDMTITPNPVNQDGSVHITALVKNEGFSSANNIKVNFYEGDPAAGGMLLGTQTISTLNAGESRTVGIDWTSISESGEKVIYVSVDPDNLIEEIRDDDDEAFTTLKILSYPDLAVSANSIFFNPPAPKPGDTVSIGAAVGNKGDQAASDVTVSAYEGDVLIGSQVIASVDADSQQEVTFSYDTTGKSGTYTIKLIADPDNKIKEQTKENNKATKNFGVQDSKLWLTEQYISPNGDGVQDSTQLFFSLDIAETVKILVVNNTGETVRTFAGPELQNVVAGNITWDGLDDNGMVVDDGQYRLNVVDSGGANLGSLLVTVDNNQSPWADAAATPYFETTNLTCNLPSVDQFRWLPYDRGIVFYTTGADYNSPSYYTPPYNGPYNNGIYSMSSDSGDAFKISDGEWRECRSCSEDGDYAFNIVGLQSSPSGEKMALTIHKETLWPNWNGFSWYWDDVYVMNSDGTHEIFVDAWANTWGQIPVIWSPDGEYIAYMSQLHELILMNTETEQKIDVGLRTPDRELQWSPDGRRLAYFEMTPSQNIELRVVDLSGNDHSVLSFPNLNTNGASVRSLEWLGNKKIALLYSFQEIVDNIQHTVRQLWVADADGTGNVQKFDNSDDYIWPYGATDDRSYVSPDHKEAAYLTLSNDISVVDGYGDTHAIYAVPNGCIINDLTWSPDSKKIIIILRESNAVTSRVVALDVETGATAVAVDKRNLILTDSEGWFNDNVSLMIRAQTPGYSYGYHYIFNCQTGKLVASPVQSPSDYIHLSPSGRYLIRDKSVDTSQGCYSGSSYIYFGDWWNYSWKDWVSWEGNRCYSALNCWEHFKNYDEWIMSSFLNLTGSLSVSKDGDEVVLRGTAADLNFDSYTLEYSDADSPGAWNVLASPSNVPVMNDVFTTWVPPYEGSFYVRLTVHDKAGNVASSEKRVYWGASSSITSIYKSTGIFSPNGDGVKDTVALRYSVLGPAHLEFDIYDSSDNLVRTLYKDESTPGADSVTWDGLNREGNVVPDGRYVIKVLDFEFSVEVDNTPPDVGLTLSKLKQDYDPETRSGSNNIYVELYGHAVDNNLRSWTFEYGEGDNPDEWHELANGSDLLAAHDDQANPILSPIQDALVDYYEESDIEFLVGKKLRITAEDLGGNKGTAVTDFLEEKILLDTHHWQEGTTDNYERFIVDSQDILYPSLIYSGLHDLGGLETVRLPLKSINIQYLSDRKWYDAAPADNPAEGIIALQWDNIITGLANAIRIKAVDIAGNVYYSNEVLIEEIFAIDGCNLVAQNSLFEDLSLLTLQLNGADYMVFDASKGDEIPVGEFPITPLPSYQESDQASMIGIGVSGKTYQSSTPLDCNPQTPPPVLSGFTLSVNYDEADCGLTADGRATVSATFEGISGSVTLDTLSYYMEESGGAQLLRQFDIATEGLGKTVIDTTVMPEGSYPLKAVLSYLDLSDSTTKEITAESTLIVDRIPPSARITYPAKSLVLCPMKMTDSSGDWEGLQVEGEAVDNAQVKRYELYYGTGDNPAAWLPAETRIQGKTETILKNTAVKGQLGLWDVTDLKGSDYSLKLKVLDVAGNASCQTTAFTIDTITDIADLTTDVSLFSPNGDGLLDRVSINYRIDEAAVVDVKVFKLVKGVDGSYAPDTTPVRTVVSGLQHISGTVTTFWAGKDDYGAVVQDGRYGIGVFATDSCGNHNVKWADVEVDDAPPTAAITYPAATDSLATIVTVKGTADDDHFESYTLEAGEGNSPDSWTLISTEAQPLSGQDLGAWDIYGLTGRWTLSLSVTDSAGNRQVTTVPVDLGNSSSLISGLSSSGIISPNGDGKLDTLTLNYSLTAACQVTIEITDVAGATRFTSNTDTPFAGTYNFIWDGKGDSGAALEDGTYIIRLTATLSSDTSVAESEALTVAIDTTPPAVAVSQPLNESYLTSDVQVTGSITDDNILGYSISYNSASGSVTVDTGKQNRTGYTFGILNELPEGKYILDEKADDLAGNTTERTTDFTIDRSPPVVTISSPLNGKYYGADKDAVSITGSITETNLDSYTIRYGTGDNPSTWNELSSGQSVPTDQRFFLWNVGKSSGLPDGLYTVSVLARDKAGLTGEARVKVTVDNTVPQVAITSPQDGSYATAPTNINGTAYDGNLDKYTLELAEGQCSAAAKWSVMQASSSSVSNGLIASWLAPPPDGYYCFRLTAVDMLGQTGQTTTNVKVDTHPPAAPALSGDIENKSTARLTWTQNSEADLSGYNFYRNSVKVNGSPLSDLGYVDQNLEEGTYTYTVKAVDRAGNESASSNQVTLKVDVTGPDTRIDLPKDGSSVSGIVDIKGTAYSSDDFRQYRVYAGQGQAPAQWSLVRTSPVPIQYGTLTQWDTTGLKGQYSIKLEAEDLTGNVNSNQITVTVDDTPPAAPVLLSATANGSDVTIRWQANSEADLADYLLFRNDQPANGDSLAISDLRPYLLTGTTYVDKSLPDGTYRYFLIAMDQAGNMSDQSNVIEVNIDTHPPHATIVEPSDGKKFDSRTLIKAESPDLDIASVRFEYKKNSETVWNVIATVTQPPYITYIDPSALGLTYGDYQIRAVALDKGGKTDPSPSYSTLTYADLAAPQAPADLVAQTNGSDVTLSWSPSAETDLSGYNVYRISGSTKTKINTSIIKEATYKDSGLPDGQYSYEVTASDTAGNESRPSNTVSAHIYAPVLMQPYTPTDQEKIAVTGSADPNATVEIYVDSDGGSELRGTVAADSSGNFGSDVTLSIGENRITVTAKDTGGNTSRPSEELEVTYGKAPATPTGLTAAFQDRNVTLTWNSNSESDLVGYNLYLNGTKVNRPLAITAGDLTASTSNSIHYASSAFDSNPSTYWLSTYSRGVFIPQCVEIDLPSPELISHIEIRWIYNSYAGKDFEIQAWTGYAWLALRKVTGNSKIQNFFDLTPSYRTDRIRIYITDVNSTSTYKYVGMSEVEIQKDNLITVTSYNDTDLQNGVYKYRLTAVDYYGFESPSSAEVGSSVGDLVPPAPPQNLSAIASGSNVELSWSENSEPDLAGYNVYRVTPNGFVKLNSSLLVSPTYTDVGLANGTYTYTVTAIDTANNESQHSTEASAAVHVVLPPPGSLAVAALQGGGSLQISWEYAGLPDLGFTLYRGTSPGGPYDKGTNTGALSYIDSGLTNGTAYYYVVTAVDGLGNESAYSNEASGIPSYAISWTDPEIYFPTISGKPLVLFEDKTDVDGEADPAYPVELYRNGVLVGSTMPNDKNVVRSFPLPSTAAVFVSPDGGKVFYSYDGSLWLENLASGDSKRTTLTNISSVAWSPDGKKIAYLYYDYYHHSRIGVYDIDEDVSSDLTEDLSVTEQYPSWSSDGSKIAYVSDKGGHYNLWLKDISTGTFTQLTSGLYPSAPSLSPDGTKIAYAFNLVPYLLDVKTGSTIQIGASSDNKTFSWSLDGKRILFMGGTENNYYNLFVFDTSTNSTTQITDTPDYKYWPLWCPDGKSVLYEVRDTNSYSIVIAYLDNEEHDIHLISGLPYCYITRTRSGAITCSLNDNLLDFFYPKGYFSFNDSRLGTGDNTFEVVSSDASGSERKSPQISVLFDNSQTPDMSVRENDIFVSPAFPQPGQGVTVNVGVRNTGVVDLNDVDVDVYLLDPDGNVQPLKSETIPMIAAGSEELIVLDWGGSPVPGKYTIMAVADPTNSIEESDETNNVATKDIFVVTGDKIIMTTTSGSDKYHSDRPVNIDINLVNPGIEKTVTITTSIEDTQRNVVSPLDTRSIDLPYGVQDVPLTWNTGTTMAGDYVIHVVLADDSGALFENTVPFSIMPNLAIDSTLTTDKADYEPNEDVNLNVNIKNAGDNYIIPETVVREKIIGPDGNVPYSEDKSPSNLLPGAEAKIDWKWSTGDSAPGSYKAAADVYIDGQLISTAEAPFTIKPTVTITGTLDISPAKVEMGKDITADYSVSNEGNVDVAGLGLGVLIVDLQSGQTIDSQDATVDLAMGASKDGAVVFSTADYELKPYSVVLRYTYNGQSKTLASQTVTIIDEEPPSVNITSPVAGFFNSTITLAATVTDNLSGVALAEYEMDDGPWQPLQPQDIAHGGYSVTWEPVKADEGVHVIGFRATDTAGNTSQPVTISITVDLTPPAPPVVVSPDDNTTLFTETVDIHGTAEPGSEVVMRGTDTVRTKADTATGDFVFSAVHLLPGDNSFALTAEDAAGNVSTSYNYGLFFDISDWFTGTVKSEPDPVYQGRDETITYSISNGGDDVSGLTVTTIIFDPDTQGVKKSFEDSIDVAANTSVTGRVVASTEDLSPKVYGIKVEISSPNMKQAKKLAEALFEVKPALEVKATLPDRERVLLWLNYACFARDDHAECPDETLIEQSLVDAGIEFNVVYDKKDFESELRNPYYTDIIVLGNHSPIEDHFSEELKEQVYSGKGLVCSMYDNQSLDGTVFGMKRTGVLPDRDYSIELPQSEISDGGTIVSHGKLLRIEARDPDEVIGWIVGGSDNQTEDYPGIVRHRYGKGKVLYYAFDLGISASYDPFRKLLDNSVQYVHRTADSGDARVFGPDQLVPAEINVKSLGDTFDLRITTSYPDTFRLFYPLEGLWVADNPWTVNMTLDPDQAGSLNYYALSPDKAGSYLFKTEVGYIDAEGSYNFYQDIEKEVRIEKETAFLYDGIITSLSALPLSGQERAKADGVISYMENVRERPVKSVDDIEKNISDLVRAKDSLLSIKGFDISGIRLSIDEILKSWESRYYYGTGGEKRKD